MNDDDRTGNDDALGVLWMLADAEGRLARRQLADGTEVALVPLTYNRARLTIGPPSGWTGYHEAW